MKKLIIFIAALAMNIIANADNVATTPQTRHVLMEDYTGFHCAPCAQAHKTVESMLKAFPEYVHPMFVHYGFKATPSDDEPDYRTEEGREMHDYFGVSGYPCGQLNRIVFNYGNAPSFQQNAGYWTHCAHEIVQQTADVNIWANATYDKETRKISIDVELCYVNEVADGGSALCVALLQNKIIGPQAGTDDVLNYEHNHMFRKSITPVWGDTIATSTQGTIVKRHYDYDLPEAINEIPTDPFNTDFIIYVISTDDATNREVLNAQGMHLNCPGITADRDVRMTEGKITTHRNYAYNYLECHVANKGSETLTSLNFTYTLNGESHEVNNVAVDIPALSGKYIKVPVDFSAQESSDNSYSLTLTGVNGDAYSGATIRGTFEGMIYLKGKVYFEFKADNLAADNTFLVNDVNGNLLQQFGPYVDCDSAVIYTDSFEVKKDVGTYAFEIQDAWGNGVLYPRGYINFFDADGKQLLSNKNIAGYGYHVFFKYGDGSEDPDQPDDPDPVDPVDPEKPDIPTPDFSQSQWGLDETYGLETMPAGTKNYTNEYCLGVDGTTWMYTYVPSTENIDSLDDATYSLRLQAIDKMGNKLFPDPGFEVSCYPNASWTKVGYHLVANVDSTVTLAVTDYRRGAKCEGYTAYRFRPDGSSVWPREGISLNVDYTETWECQMSLLSRADGSNVFAWQRVTPEGGHYIERCHISKDGVMTTTPSETRMGTRSTDYYSYPQLVSAGDDGSYYLTYARTSSYVLYTQKYNADGTKVWSDTFGKKMYSGGWGDLPTLLTRFNCISDGKGGVAIAFNADPSGVGDPKPFISWIKADGTIGYVDENGKPWLRLAYCDEMNLMQYMPRIIPSPDGNGFIAAIGHYNSSKGLSIQKVDSTGVLLWSDYGYFLTSVYMHEIGHYSIQPGYGKQFMVAWQQGAVNATNNDVANHYTIMNSENCTFVLEDSIRTLIPVTNYRSGLTTMTNKQENYWMFHWEQAAGVAQTTHYCLAPVGFDGEMAVGGQEDPEKPEFETPDFSHSRWGLNDKYGYETMAAGTKNYDNEYCLGVDGTMWMYTYVPSTENPDSLKDATYSLRLQAIDKMGNKLFPDPGFEVSNYPNASWTKIGQHLVANADSTVTLAVTDYRRGSACEGYSVYRFRPDGTSVWPREGISLNVDYTETWECQMSMISLPDGSNVFAWQRYPTDGGAYIERCHISKDGVMTTTPSETRLGSRSSDVYSYPSLINGGDDGSYYLIYARTSSAVLYAQKYNADGTKAWSEAYGKKMYSGGWGEMAALQNRFNCISDGKGGVAIAFNADPSGVGDPKPYLSWIKADGTMGYVDENGKPWVRLAYCDDFNLMQYMPQVIPSPDGNGFIAAIGHYNNSKALSIQKVDSTGTLLWKDYSYFLTTVDLHQIGYYSIRPGFGNQFLVAWEQGDTYTQSTDIANYYTIIDCTDLSFVLEDSIRTLIPYKNYRAGLTTFVNQKENYWVFQWQQADALANTAHYCMAPVTFDGKLVVGSKQDTVIGDANGDGTVDVADITTIAAYILGAYPELFDEKAADANQDGTIDVADITATAAIILGSK